MSEMLYITGICVNLMSYICLIVCGMQDEEGEASGGGSDRDSDAEFEQMLQEAEEANTKEPASEEGGQGGEEGSGDTPIPKRKAKTKIGNKSKKKKKTKTTSKFPSGEGEDGYEVL